MSEKRLGERSRMRAEAELADRYPISVIVPARNASSTLQRCLQALSRNNLRGVEVWVVDDASEDDTAGIAGRVAPAFQTLRLEERQGPAGARNAGARRAARHPYLFFVDADVLLGPRSISFIRETLDLYSHRPEVAGVLGQYAERIPWEDFFTQYKNLYTCYLYRTTESLSPFLHSAILCIRRDVFEEGGGFETRLSTGEDFHLGLKLASRGFRFAIDRRIHAVHLKGYSFLEILREDWRRIRDLRAIPVRREARRFYFRAHRPSRLLSLALPAPILGLAVAGLFHDSLLLAAGLLAGLFLLSHSGFLRYGRRQRGVFFALQSAAFLFVEMLWASLAVAVSLIRDRPGMC